MAEIWSMDPIGKDGSYNILTPWAGRKPYWACMLLQAAVEVKSGIAEAERRRMVDKKVVHLTKVIHAMPRRDERRVATDLCERLRTMRSEPGYEQGGTRLRRFLSILDQFFGACDSHDDKDAD